MIYFRRQVKPLFKSLPNRLMINAFKYIIFTLSQNMVLLISL